MNNGNSTLTESAAALGINLGTSPNAVLHQPATQIFSGNGIHATSPIIIIT